MRPDFLLLSFLLFTCGTISGGKHKYTGNDPLVELTTTSVQDKTDLTSSQLSIWGIFLGMDEANFNNVIHKKENLITELRTLQDGKKVVNVLHNSRKTNYDFFCVVIENGNIKEITLFNGIADHLEAFNKGLVSDQLLNESSSVFTRFLGLPDEKVTKDYGNNEGKDGIAFKRGFEIVIRRNLRYNSETGNLDPVTDVAFTLK